MEQQWVPAEPARAPRSTRRTRQPSPLAPPPPPLQVKGPQAKVHWWYLPDSYDEWVPAAATPGTAEAPRRPPRGPWHVYARWLTDSEKYNE